MTYQEPEVVPVVTSLRSDERAELDRLAGVLNTSRAGVARAAMRFALVLESAFVLHIKNEDWHPSYLDEPDAKRFTYDGHTPLTAGQLIQLFAESFEDYPEHMDEVLRAEDPYGEAFYVVGSDFTEGSGVLIRHEIDPAPASVAEGEDEA